MVKVKIEGGDPDAWLCRCGNTPAADGFNACDENGLEVEPVPGWSGLDICPNCGAIIDEKTREIVAEVLYRVTGKIDQKSGAATVSGVERVVRRLRKNRVSR